MHPISRSLQLRCCLTHEVRFVCVRPRKRNQFEGAPGAWCHSLGVYSMAIKWSRIAPLACTVAWLACVYLVTLVGTNDPLSVCTAARAVALIVSVGIETRGAAPLVFIALSTAALFHPAVVPMQYALLAACSLTANSPQRAGRWQGAQ